MVKRTYNLPDDEPDQKKFELPSQKEHLFQVTDVYTTQDNPFANGLPEDIIAVKMEVCGGDEEGRTLLQRLSLDSTWKGFFATRLFLKAIGQHYKGNDLQIDSDFWFGSQFYATVVHNVDKGKTYANIDQYNFEKIVETRGPKPLAKENKPKGEEIAWDE